MKNKKSNFGKFMAILICLIVLSLLTVVYAKTLFGSAAGPIIDNYEIVDNTDKSNMKVSLVNAEKDEMKATPTTNTDEIQAGGPTISIGSINAEHRNDPDYDTYELTLTDPYYTCEVDGKKIRKRFAIVNNGTISIKKTQSSAMVVEEIPETLNDVPVQFITPQNEEIEDEQIPIIQEELAYVDLEENKNSTRSKYVSMDRDGIFRARIEFTYPIISIDEKLKSAVEVLNSEQINCLSANSLKTNGYSLLFEFSATDNSSDYKLILPKGLLVLDTSPRRSMNETDKMENPNLYYQKTKALSNNVEFILSVSGIGLASDKYIVKSSPNQDEIIYLPDDSNALSGYIDIDNNYTIDQTKKVFFNGESIEYSVARETEYSRIEFLINNLVERTSNSIQLENGMITNKQGLTNLKQELRFSTILRSKINLPDYAVFNDLRRDDWAYEAISALSAAGIISGYEDGSFNPDGIVTRAELQKVVALAFHTENIDINVYSDVSNHWVEKYLKDADGLVPLRDNNNLFQPDQPTTRSEVAVALVRSKNLRVSKTSNETLYEDLTNVKSELYDEFMCAIDNGIIKGYEDGTLRPEEPVHRREIAVMVYRMLQ